MDWKEIESRQNDAVKLAASLGDKKARDREGLFACEGITLLFDFLEKGLLPRAVYLSRRAEGMRKKIDGALSGKNIRGYLLSDSAFEKITTEKGSQGILSLYAKEDLAACVPLLRTRRLVALENVQDPGNVGTVIRSAASFGFDAVLLTGCADPFGPKAIRASMGAVGAIPTLSFSDTAALFAFLEEKEVRTVAACLHTESVSIKQAPLQEPVCVLIGNEGKGLSQEAMEKSRVKCIIPIERTESLNAASAATIFCWEIAGRNQ